MMMMQGTDYNGNALNLFKFLNNLAVMLKK